MGKTTGKFKITCNGKFADTFDGVTFDPGGAAFATVQTAHNIHRSESTKPSRLEFDRAFLAGSSINDFALDGQSVTVESNTGQTWVIASMHRLDPETVSDDGKGKIVLEGEPAQEML